MFLTSVQTWKSDIRKFFNLTRRFDQTARLPLAITMPQTRDLTDLLMLSNVTSLEKQRGGPSASSAGCPDLRCVFCTEKQKGGRRVRVWSWLRTQYRRSHVSHCKCMQPLTADASPICSFSLATAWLLSRQPDVGRRKYQTCLRFKIREAQMWAVK